MYDVGFIDVYILGDDKTGILSLFCVGLDALVMQIDKVR